MTKTIKLVKREGVFIPIKDITPMIRKRIEEKLTFKFYDDKACKKCEFLEHRHSDICDQCPAFLAGYQLSPVVKVGAKGNKYLKVPIGSYEQIVALLEAKGFEVTIKDLSPSKPIRPIKFLGKFREGQKDAVKAMRVVRRGVIKAPPRSGKTVSSSAFICSKGRKTLIIASQVDWLNGFRETFIGSKLKPDGTRDLEPLTDLNPARIKLCKTLKDFRSHDICMATVQTFYSPGGQRILEKIRDMFEVIVGDEIHLGAADKFIQILAKFNCRYMIGLSATPSRKDAKFILVRHVVGPIIHEVVVPQMRPAIKLVKTKYKKAYKGNVRWTTMVSGLENDPGRLKLIAEAAIKDVAAGHMIIIPFSQVKPVNKLIALINEMAGRQLAHPFLGGMKKREETILAARAYKIKILVGTMKILSTGLNIPRASALYEVAMSSNKENAEQRMTRVLTHMDGKPQPIIRFFLDDSNVRKNCLRNEYFSVLLPKLKPIITDRDKMLIEGYLKSKTQDQHSKFEL